jgi:lethal(3)malignant brain tumor-like protein
MLALSFLQAPLNELWAQFAPDMKLEVSNTDCLTNPNEAKDEVFWFAKVVRMEGYLALLRYEGYDDDASMDFWCNLGHRDVHCVGWCGQLGVKLAPPRSELSDWIIV